MFPVASNETGMKFGRRPKIEEHDLHRKAYDSPSLEV